MVTCTIPLNEESKQFVVITKGLYWYNCLPFSITSSPVQYMMESILQGVPHVTVYIDDILVTGISDLS